MGVHHVQATAVSVTQATELRHGIPPRGLSALTATAEAARTPRCTWTGAIRQRAGTPCAAAGEATWKSGIDVLSLGASKNGALCAEAVVFFNPALAEEFERRRKQAGHLWSKLRYLELPAPRLSRGRRVAAQRPHANGMASRLAEAWQSAGARSCCRTMEANEMFVALPERQIEARAGGFSFLSLAAHQVAEGAAVRLVTSYATSEADVDDFLGEIRRLA